MIEAGQEWCGRGGRRAALLLCGGGPPGAGFKFVIFGKIVFIRKFVICEICYIQVMFFDVFDGFDP